MDAMDAMEDSAKRQSHRPSQLNGTDKPFVPLPTPTGTLLSVDGSSESMLTSQIMAFQGFDPDQAETIKAAAWEQDSEDELPDKPQAVGSDIAPFPSPGTAIKSRVVDSRLSMSGKQKSLPRATTHKTLELHTSLPVSKVTSPRYLSSWAWSYSHPSQNSSVKNLDCLPVNISAIIGKMESVATRNTNASTSI